jgi:hypothetical protein
VADDGGRIAQPVTRLARTVQAVGQAAASSVRPHHEEHRQANWLRDVILGGQDGLVNILGIILGVIAGGGSKAVLLSAGFAAAITESISMGAVGYTSAVADRDYYEAERAREAAEIDTVPEEERREIREIYASKGFSGELLDRVVDTITANRDSWLATMMDEELHLQPVQSADILRSSVVITVATLIGDWRKWPAGLDIGPDLVVGYVTRQDAGIKAELRCYAEFWASDPCTRIPRCTDLPRYLELRFGRTARPAGKWCPAGYWRMRRTLGGTSATLDSGRRNAPRYALRRATCGYDVIVRKEPATCPMCHGSVPPTICTRKSRRQPADWQAAGSDLVLPPAFSASRPHRVAVPTFQVPSWRTATPDWFVSTGLPLSRRS